jgi:iron-sulfur cluster insertion protein
LQRVAAAARTAYLEAMTIEITQSAAARVALIAAKQGKPAILRLSVEGGGCSGFQYKFELVSAAETDDLVIERAGALVVIDQVSVGYLGGSEIDFVDDLMGQSFKIRNPNATASCGCGTSFSL